MATSQSLSKQEQAAKSLVTPAEATQSSDRTAAQSSTSRSAVRSTEKSDIPTEISLRSQPLTRHRPSVIELASFVSEDIAHMHHSEIYTAFQTYLILFSCLVSNSSFANDTFERLFDSAFVQFKSCALIIFPIMG